MRTSQSVDVSVREGRPREAGLHAALFMTGLAGGGAERVMLTLADELSRRGVSIDLVVTHSRGPLRQDIPEDVRLVDLQSPRIILALPSLMRYLNRAKPTVMLSAMAPANVVALVARSLVRAATRLVVVEHSTLSAASSGSQSLRERLLPRLMRLTYPRAAAVVAVSSGVADDLANTIGLGRAKIRVIHNPIVSPRLSHLAGEIVEHPWFAEGEPPVVLGVGRLVAAKNFELLVRAFSIVRGSVHARLVILGEGPERRKLERLIDRLDLTAHVKLPGYTDNPYSFMRQADVLALSSRWEGLPTVLVEAMAVGTPVVSVDCPSGPAEILENGAWGRLIEREAPHELAVGILQAFREPRGRAISRAAEFGVERVVDSYAELLHAQSASGSRTT